MLRSWAQSRMEIPTLAHSLRNSWPLFTAPALGVAELPPTLTVAPLRRAMLSSWAQSATEMPRLRHWLVKICPLLVGVGEAALVEEVLLELE